MTKVFLPCEICGSRNWQPQYNGKVRDGSFGNLSEEECVVARCPTCGVERLNDSACRDTDFYEGGEYKQLISEPEAEADSRADRNLLTAENLNIKWPDELKDKIVAEIGCAGGHFLKRMKRYADQIIAIEPSRIYHESLREQGYRVYPFVKDAIEEWGGKVDFSFCFAVIEHTQNPRIFLEEITDLLSTQGQFILSTPNRHDILMDLKVDDYKRFFYRTVHRWYFDAASFIYCAREAGLKVIETHCVHRFGLSNAMAWLRDGKPTGDIPLPHLDSPLLDNFWKRYVESKGVGDYLYFKIRRES